MRRLTWDELHPDDAGKAYCPTCERPVGGYHHADCKRYPALVTDAEAVR